MKVDSIIVGQGLAGSLLYHRLRKLGQKIVVFDPSHTHSASVVSAGVINPLTGIKFVLSWNYPTLEANFLPFYNQIEKSLQTKILYPTAVERGISLFSNQNDLYIKSREDHNRPYFLRPIEYEDTTAYIKGYRVDVAHLLLRTKEMLEREEAYRDEKIDYNRLEISSQGFIYKGVESDRIFFAEGISALENPFFTGIELRPFKGHVLIYQDPESKPIENIINRRGKFLLDYDQNRFWFGSANEKDTNGWEINPNVEAALKKQFAEIYPDISDHVETITHVGVRPTVRNRVPVIGEHPTVPNMYYLNGLGTKGASLGPWVVNCLVDSIHGDQPIPSEISVLRYF